MPINCTIEVSREIKSLLFVNDGSLNVVLLRIEDGQVKGGEAYKIDPIDASALLDVEPIPGLTTRQQIIFSVYQFLVTTGAVKGEVAA